MKLTEKELCSLVRYFNKKSEPTFFGPAYEQLCFLMTRPEERVVGKGRGSAEALRSGYSDALFLVLEEINRVLKVRLEARYATKKLWEYRGDSETSRMHFPIESKATIRSEITWVSRTRLRPVTNPYHQPHTNKGRGFIRTPWGRFLVTGELSERPPVLSGKKYWYWLIARTLVNGQFTKFRNCRGCQLIFLANHLRKATCTTCGDIYNKYRAEISRRKRAERKQEDIRKDERRQDVERFGKFLRKANGAVTEQMTVGKFIKGKLPGGWNKVDDWLSLQNQGVSIEDIWLSIPAELRTAVRDRDLLKL